MWREYRRKPVIVRAAQWDPNTMSAKDFDEYIGGKHGDRGMVTGVLGDTNGVLSILTPDGLAVANPGDWVVADTCGNLYPYKDVSFRRMYEEVVDV